MTSSAPKTVPAPAALTAFLRGIERRGAVLAELQTGDAAIGDAALASAMHGFRAQAETLALSDWPARFWARLLAEPNLRRHIPVAVPLAATDRLADLGSGPRVALLLRLAAGLDEAEAAAALGIAVPSYRLALQRALPHQPDGRADPQAWQRLGEQIHRRIKTLPPERLVHLARAREAALAGTSLPAEWHVAPPAAAARRRPRGLLPVLWGLLALCALAMAATFWWPLDHWLPGGPDTQQVRIEPLPPAEAPATHYGREAGLLSHRDFSLLTDPMAETEAEDLAFYSWYAAQGGDAAMPPALPPLPPLKPEADEAPETTGVNSETFDAPF